MSSRQPLTASHPIIVCTHIQYEYASNRGKNRRWKKLKSEHLVNNLIENGLHIFVEERFFLGCAQQWIFVRSEKDFRSWQHKLFNIDTNTKKIMCWENACIKKMDFSHDFWFWTFKLNIWSNLVHGLSHW